MITISSKPTLEFDWVSTDDPTKLTSQSQGEQDIGFVAPGPASPSIFNWCLNRISKWLTFLNELELNQVSDSTDYKKVKTESLTSNEVDHTKILNKGSNSHTTIDSHIGASAAHGVSGDVVGTSDNQTLTTKTIDADNNTISNLAHGSEVDNPSSGVHGVVGSVVGTSDNQTLTTKTIDADNNTISNLAHGSEVDNPTTAHGTSSAIVGKDDTQTLTQKTLTSPKINEDVVLASTSSEIDAAVSGGLVSSSVIDNKLITEDFVSDPAGRVGIGKTGVRMLSPTQPVQIELFSAYSYTRKTGNQTSSTPNKLTDSGGGFSGVVAIGDYVINTTDSLDTTVSGIDSDTVLSLNSNIFNGTEAYEIISHASGDVNIGNTGASLAFDYSANTIEYDGVIKDSCYGVMVTDSESNKQTMRVFYIQIQAYYNNVSYGPYQARCRIIDQSSSKLSYNQWTAEDWSSWMTHDTSDGDWYFYGPGSGADGYVTLSKDHKSPEVLSFLFPWSDVSLDGSGDFLFPLPAVGGSPYDRTANFLLGGIFEDPS